MKYCPKCGAEITEEGARFCPNCGAPVEEAPETRTTPAPAPAPTPVYTAPVQQVVVEPTDHTAEYDAKDISVNKVVAMCPYLLSVVGVIIALLASKESPFVAFHVRQALKVQICQVLILVFCIIPFLGWLASGICALILIVLNIIGFFNVCFGKAKELPILSSLGFLK